MPYPKKILVTGAHGFVGSALIKELIAQKKSVVGAARKASNYCYGVGDIDGATYWSEALHNVETVVHTIARTHVMHETSADPLLKYCTTNVEATLNLARQAAAAGVKKFIFISSVKVNGERTLPGQPFTERSTPQPEDAYGISKYEAEQGLWELAQHTEMKMVVIRPPLIYGPGVRANFLALFKLVEKKIPLPLASVNNRRSFIALGNLIDFIQRCIDLPQADHQTFLISDDADLSTPELIRQMTAAMNQATPLIPRIFPTPVFLLRSAAILLGKKNIADRLFGSLQVDISKARAVMGWRPKISVQEGLRLIEKRARRE